MRVSLAREWFLPCSGAPTRSFPGCTRLQGLEVLAYAGSRRAHRFPHQRPLSTAATASFLATVLRLASLPTPARACAQDGPRRVAGRAGARRPRAPRAAPHHGQPLQEVSVLRRRLCAPPRLCTRVPVWTVQLHCGAVRACCIAGASSAEEAQRRRTLPRTTTATTLHRTTPSASFAVHASCLPPRPACKRLGPEHEESKRLRAAQRAAELPPPALLARRRAVTRSCHSWYRRPNAVSRSTGQKGACTSQTWTHQQGETSAHAGAGVGEEGGWATLVCVHSQGLSHPIVPLRGAPA